jgi:diamine N-acetyltransferase
MDSIIPGAEIRTIDEEDLWLVCELASRIFPVTYRDIVSAAQIRYMLDLIYSPESLIEQLDAGQMFFILYFEGEPAGFTSYTHLEEEGLFKLNKIYLDFPLHGMGLGKFQLSDIISRVKESGGKALQLNVNRHNPAREFYEKLGFTVINEVLIDIGNGYFMDDFVMQLELEA